MCPASRSLLGPTASRASSSIWGPAMTTLFLVLSLLATTALGGTLALPSMAQVPPAITETLLPVPSKAQPTQLDALTTAATRTRRPIDEVTSTVSIITNEDIHRDNMQDMRDLVRNEPGV